MSLAMKLMEEFNLLKASDVITQEADSLNYTWFISKSTFVYSRGITSDSYKDVYKGMKNYFAFYFMKMYF